MEAPQKLYLHQTAKGKVGASWLTFPLTNEDIEYIRKDAFIEKASGWLEQTLEPYMPYCDIDIDLVIEGFKKYMKQ